MHLKTQNTDVFCDVNRTKKNTVSSSDDQDNLVLQMYDEHEESEIDLLFRNKRPDWPLKFFDSQVESYELLAPGFEDDERTTWIKNIYYILQHFIPYGASQYDTYIRSQWECACRLKLMPAWSGDSLRRVSSPP